MLEKEPLMHLRLETKSYLRTKEPKTSVLHLKKKEKESESYLITSIFFGTSGPASFQANAQQHLRAGS